MPDQTDHGTEPSNQRDGDRDRFSITYAASQVPDDPGALSYLRKLLEEGVDPDFRDEDDGWTLLMFVVRNNSSDEAARLLVEAGADIHLGDYRDGSTALHHACGMCRRGTECIQYLLSLGANPNAENDNGRTPLMAAAGNENSFAACRVLLQVGADVHAQDERGNTVLHCVGHSSKPDPRTIELLLNAGAKPDVRNDGGVTPFIAMIRAGCGTGCIWPLLERGVDINAKTKRGDTALHRAIWWGSGSCKSETIDLLLKRGANPNVIDGVGESPLYLAHSAGNSEAIRLLTEHGAILTCKSPLHLAVIRGELDEVRKLIEGGSSVDSVDGANVPLLHLAINVGHDDIIEFLLENGADPLARLGRNHENAIAVAIRTGHVRNVRRICERLEEFKWDYDTADASGGPWGWISPLHEALRSKSCEIAEYFIERGVDVNERFNWSSTPLEIAVSDGHLEMVNLLLKHGADPGLSSLGGFTTPLLEATARGHVEIVRSLIRHGAPPDTTGDRKLSALHNAAIDGNVEIIRILLEAGADPNSRTTEGWTPLHLAAANGNSAATQALLDGRSYVNLTDNMGNTPLLCAAARGCAESVTILLENGADLKLKNDEGFSPLRIAQANEHDEVVEVLLEYEEE